MRQVVLGRTGLRVTKSAFGCLPIQRVSMQEAVAMLRRAAEAGITYFDTARLYTDSEEKIGAAFEGRRKGIVLSTKSMAEDGDCLLADLNESLRLLRTDTIDIFQFHNPSFVPGPGGEDGLYDAALKARQEGKIRHIGITQHSIALAEAAAESGLYATLQYPFNHLATEREIALVRRCGALGVGFIAMKALSGGLITDAAVPLAFLSQFENVVPIWGFQRMDELENVLMLQADPPALDAAMRARIDRDRAELGGAFCRGCGYCQPCPVDIPIYNANRMTQLIARSPDAPYRNEFWRTGMARIADCTRCGICAARCPYGIKPYETLPGHLAFYQKYMAEHGG